MVFVGLSGSLRFILNSVFSSERNIAITFEKAVASLAANWKNKSEKGTVMAPPEIPEIDPMPERTAMVRIPSSSTTVVTGECGRRRRLTVQRKNLFADADVVGILARANVLWRIAVFVDDAKVAFADNGAFLGKSEAQQEEIHQKIHAKT